MTECYNVCPDPIWPPVFFPWRSYEFHTLFPDKRATQCEKIQTQRQQQHPTDIKSNVAWNVLTISAFAEMVDFQRGQTYWDEMQ